MFVFLFFALSDSREIAAHRKKAQSDSGNWVKRNLFANTRHELPKKVSLIASDEVRIEKCQHAK